MAKTLELSELELPVLVLCAFFKRPKKPLLVSKSILLFRLSIVQFPHSMIVHGPTELPSRLLPTLHESVRLIEIKRLLSGVTLLRSRF